MKHFNSLLPLLILALFCSVSLSSNAESKVYIFHGYQINTDNTISVNGKEVGKLNGSYQKTKEFSSCTVPMVYNNNAYATIELPSDERTTITVEMVYTIPASGEKTTYKGEATITPEDGEDYYFEVKPNGLSDMKLKPVKAKDGAKKLNNKKWEALPVITVQ